MPVSALLTAASRTTNFISEILEDEQFPEVITVVKT